MPAAHGREASVGERTPKRALARRPAPRRAVTGVLLALVPTVSAGISAAGASIIDVVDFSPPRDHVAECLPGLTPHPRHGGLVMGISPVPAVEAAAAELAPVLASAPRSMTVQLWAHYRSADSAELEDEIAGLEAEIAFWEAKGYRLTLTIPYRTTESLVADYARFVSRVLARVGSHLERVYVTNEANLASPATSDGASPGVVDALVRGVAAADHTVARKHLRIKIGFKVAASILDEPFWSALGAKTTRRFAKAIDVIGVDLYPTPFTVQPDEDISGFVIGNLALLRGCRLPALGLGHASLDVTEAGASHFWFRPYEHQAQVLQTMIRTAYDYSRSLDIIGWTQWGLGCDPTGTEVPGDLLGCLGLIDSTGTHLPSFDVFANAAATNGAFEPRAGCRSGAGRPR